LLEVARAISESKVAFEYTVLLCWFSGEEQGLVGSRAYAKHLADTNQMVLAMFNADMLGWKLPGTSVTVGMKDRFVADWLLAIANTLAELYVPQLIVGESARSVPVVPSSMFLSLSLVLYQILIILASN
jgi:Zn-dependent M28 family amino/carboxypeptidase